EHALDDVRVDVNAPDGEHVVDAPVNPVRQAAVGASARAGLARDPRQVARVEADHRLRRALEMGIDGHALPVADDRLTLLAVDDLRVDDVVPEMHPGAGGALG